MGENNKSDLLSTKEAAAMLKVSMPTLLKFLKDGTLSGVKVGRQWRIQRSAIENLFSAKQ